MIFGKNRKRRAVITVLEDGVSIRHANGFDIAYTMIACIKVLEDSGVVLNETVRETIKGICSEIFAAEGKLKKKAECFKPEDTCEHFGPTGWCSKYDMQCEEVPYGPEL